MKHITREFDLFEDANGTFGAAIKDSKKYGFDAFWTGTGLFHDCFEHWFEGQGKWAGKNAYTVFGEIAALAAALYYQSNYAWNRNDSNYYTMQDSVFNELHRLFVNKEDYGKHGFRLPDPDDCPVKKQRPFGDIYVDELADDLLMEYSTIDKAYRPAIRNCARWGGRMAKKLAFLGMDNALDDLDRFTKDFSAEDFLGYDLTVMKLRFKVDKGYYVKTQVLFDDNYYYSSDELNTGKWFDINHFCIDLLYKDFNS